MIAISLGSFVVNLGRLADIPRGEGRVFHVGGHPISIFHTPDSNVLASSGGPDASGSGELKTYPAAINDAGDILVEIEKLWSRA